jgi:hypothetical protein
MQLHQRGGRGHFRRECGQTPCWDGSFAAHPHLARFISELLRADRMRQLSWILVTGLLLLTSGTGRAEAVTREFVYLALGASDATGVGVGSTGQGYVSLLKEELERLVLLWS